MVEAGQVALGKSSRIAFWGGWAQLALAVFVYLVLFGSPHSAGDKREAYGVLAFMAAGSLFALVANLMLADERSHKVGRRTAAVMGAILLLTVVFSVVGLFLIVAAVAARGETGDGPRRMPFEPWHLSVFGCALAIGWAILSSGGWDPELLELQEGAMGLYLPLATGVLSSIRQTRMVGLGLGLLFGIAFAYTFYLIPLAAPLIGAFIWQVARKKPSRSLSWTPVQ